MEKSIERIWKEGFINPDLSLVPEIKDVKSLQSVYILDKFKARYRVNNIILVATAVLVLSGFIFGGIPIIGFFVSILFLGFAVLGQQELNKLDYIHLGASNYTFLKDIDHWLKNLLTKFSMIYKIGIPLFFIGFSLGLLQTTFLIPFIGETLLERLFDNYEAYRIGDVPILVLLGIFLMAGVLSYFSNFILQKEIKSLFGDLIAQLEKLLLELEALK